MRVVDIEAANLVDIAAVNTPNPVASRSSVECPRLVFAIHFFE